MRRVRVLGARAGKSSPGRTKMTRTALVGFRHFTRKDQERSAQLWKQAMAQKRMYENEFQIRTRDGSYRHLHVEAVPIIAPDGAVHEWIGAAVDITQQKEIALTVQRQRDELAHVARINTIGELAASLAHELNQPLTAILSNAQAAQRFLTADPTSLTEVRAILQDIVNDDNRAGEVIRRVRDLVRKGNFEIAPLDLETILRDVVMLIHSDAVLHNVNIVLKWIQAREEFTVIRSSCNRSC